MRNSAVAYVFLLFVLTLPLSAGWLLNLAAGNPGVGLKPHPTVNFDLPVIKATLGGAEGPEVTLRATLILHSAAQASVVGQKLPRLVDAILAQLRELPAADSERRRALAALRERLIGRVNGVLAPEKIDDLLIREVTVR